MMFQRINFIILIIFTLKPFNVCMENIKTKDFSLLRDFTCEIVKDELEKHPEMRTVVMIEIQNDFPHSFSRELLKCLPEYLTKLII